MHAEQANAHLVAHQFAGHAHSAIAQVVDVVPRLAVGDVLRDQRLQCVDNVHQVKHAALVQFDARQVEPHLVHVAVGAAIHLGYHTDDTRSPSANRREPPRLERALADALGVDQLARFDDAVAGQKTVLHDGDFAMGDGIVGRGTAEDRLRGNGHRLSQGLGDLLLDPNRAGAVFLRSNQGQ